MGWAAYSTCREIEMAESSNDKPRETYEPLTEAQIEEWRRRLKAYTDPDHLPGRHDATMDTICDMAINSLLYGQEIDRLRNIPSHVGENSEERRLRHRLEKIDAALDELGAPKTEEVHGLTMELSRVGRIKRLVQSASGHREKP
jgi:hypothetical protein